VFGLHSFWIGFAVTAGAGLWILILTQRATDEIARTAEDVARAVVARERARDPASGHGEPPADRPR